MTTKSKKLLEKSINAAIAAIEIYNKPYFKYREENFCILMFNAWELLLKAKLVNEGFNIFKEEKNRSGNSMTISVFDAINIINNSEVKEKISKELITNIEILTEVRDNSIHFYNPNLNLAKKVLEIGTATLKNYTNRIQLWFNQGLNKYNFFLMPISFYNQFEIEHLSITKSNKLQRNLFNFILEKENIFKSDPAKTDNVTLKFETKFVRTLSPTAFELRITNDPKAPAIQLTEEQIMKRHPWTYSRLNKELSKKFSDFKINEEYHKLRYKIYDNPKYHRRRPFNPLKPEKGGTEWFSPAVLDYFSKYYTNK